MYTNFKEAAVNQNNNPVNEYVVTLAESHYIRHSYFQRAILALARSLSLLTVTAIFTKNDF